MSDLGFVAGVFSGAAVLLTGQVSGVAIRGVLKRQNHPSLPPSKGAMCDCKHPKSLHAGGNGKCAGGFDYYKKPIMGSSGAYHKCGCQMYVGPEPLPEFFAPELPR